MEKDRPIQSKKRYLFAFLIGTAIFILVFFISYYVSYLEFQRISNFQVETAFTIFEDKLNYVLFGEDICSEQAFQKISLDLGFQGRIIDDLEQKLGKQDERVLFRKEFYTLIELEHLEFIKMMKEKCDAKINTILFFYSNEKKDIENSENLGVILNSVYNRNPKILIYSFDVNLNSTLIENLKNLYKIKTPNTLVINENASISSPKNIVEIESYLN